MNEMEFINTLYEVISNSFELFSEFDASVSVDGDHKSTEIIISMGGKQVVISSRNVEDDQD